MIRGQVNTSQGYRNPIFYVNNIIRVIREQLIFSFVLVTRCDWHHFGHVVIMYWHWHVCEDTRHGLIATSMRQPLSEFRGESSLSSAPGMFTFVVFFLSCSHVQVKVKHNQSFYHLTRPMDYYSWRACKSIFVLFFILFFPCLKMPGCVVSWECQHSVCVKWPEAIRCHSFIVTFPRPNVYSWRFIAQYAVHYRKPASSQEAHLIIPFVSRGLSKR